MLIKIFMNLSDGPLCPHCKFHGLLKRHHTITSTYRKMLLEWNKDWTYKPGCICTQFKTLHNSRDKSYKPGCICTQFKTLHNSRDKS
jgi:hypothetical protein